MNMTSPKTSPRRMSRSCWLRCGKPASSWSARDRKPYLHGLQSGHSPRGLSLRLPLNGTIEVTRRCPSTCVHCYNNLPMGDREARSRELTTSEHCGSSTSWPTPAACGSLHGRRDLRAARFPRTSTPTRSSKGFLITLFTNGTLITERIADYLVEWRPFAIEITLYGRTRRNLRAADRRARLVRPVPARHQRSARARAAAGAEDGRRHGQQARDLGHAAVRRGARRRVQVRRDDESRGSTARRAR